MNYKKNLFLLSLFLLFSITAKCTVIDDVRTEARALFLTGLDGAQSEQYYKNILLDINDEGEFINGSVDYPDHKFEVEHLQKLIELTQVRALVDGGSDNYSYFEDDTNMANLEAKIVSGLNWWYNNVDYHEDEESWWWNQIGKQRELHKISVLFHDYLTDPNNDTVLELIEPGTTNSVTIYHPSAPTVGITNITDAISADYPTTLQDPGDTDDYSGANKADIAVSIVAKGLLENNQTWFDTGKEAFRCTMIFATDANEQDFDGIREDYSFNQHNFKDKGFLYSGGYGKSHIHNVVTWGTIFENAGDGFDLADKAIFFDFMLEGFRRMIIGKVSDFSTGGRYIARTYPNNNSTIPPEDMLLAIEMAGGAGTSIGGRLATMKQKIDAGERQTFDSENHKFFHMSDYVVHHESDYFTSVRMCSNRTIGTESINQENKKGYWLPYGCTFIYLNGSEYIRPDPTSTETDPTKWQYYENIFPFWDWTKIPGVTCPDFMPEFNHPGKRTIRSSQIDLDYGCGNTMSGEDEFVGNTTNGKYGVSTFLLNKDYDNNILQSNYTEVGDDEWETDCSAINQVNLSAKKAWFHFGNEIIALGSDIVSTDPNVLSQNPDYEINTTVNQVLLETGTFGTGTEGTTGWVSHGNIMYLFPNGQSYAPPLTGNQAGSWDDIDDCVDDNTTAQECAADGDVFKLWIEHGSPSASSPGSYIYRVVPDVASGTPLTTFLSENTITYSNVNNTDLQWVKKVGADGFGLTGIVYYPGTAPVNVQVNNNLTLRTDHPCALLYDEYTGEVCISSPNRDFSTIDLIVNDDISSPITFTMPSEAENMEGTSTCKTLFALAANIKSHCVDVTS